MTANAQVASANVEPSPAFPLTGPVALGARTILPARRTDIEFVTADGLTLVGELAEPVDDHGRAVEPVATIIALHPLPTHGGYMDSHVFRKASWRLPALARIAVLRFNFRGVSSPRGSSGGTFSGGVSERHDVRAAVRWALERGLPNIWLVGWSFGTEVALKHGRLDGVEGIILLSPPLHRASTGDLAQWDVTGRPVVAIIPEFDDYLRPAEAANRFAGIRRCAVIAVPGAKHLWVGERAVTNVLNEVVHSIDPALAPLPHTWNGRYTMSDRDPDREFGAP